MKRPPNSITIDEVAAIFARCEGQVHTSRNLRRASAMSARQGQDREDGLRAEPASAGLKGDAQTPDPQPEKRSSDND